MIDYNKFGILILSNKRADNIKTLKTLEKCGYTGKINIIIDDEDTTQDEYHKIHGDKIIVFNKEESIKKTDTICLEKKHNAVVYARNICWDVAEKLGLDYFLVLDDDYTDFNYRYKEDFKLKSKTITNLDKLFQEILKWLSNEQITCVALAQAGDFIGGYNNENFDKEVLRKIMNSFFFKTKDKIIYTGLTNEDVNAYLNYGRIGKLLFTITFASLNQTITQKNKGGLTDIYLEDGTYIKSFYSVITAPDCCKINMMGSSHKRFHHNINWENAVPKIISEKYRKE